MRRYICDDCKHKRLGTPALVEHFKVPEGAFGEGTFTLEICPACHQTTLENEELWRREKKNQVHANWVDGRPDKGVHINDLRKAAGLPGYSEHWNATHYK